MDSKLTRQIMNKQKKKNIEAQSEPQQADFPGYPPYPPEDDIIRHDTRVEGNLSEEDLDLMASKGPTVPVPKDEAPAEATPSDSPGDFDVTEEDLEALGPVDLSLDLGEDEQLKQRSHPVDFAGSNLDVPGTGDDDAQEAVGSEDEENNSYSLEKQNDD